MRKHHSHKLINLNTSHIPSQVLHQKYSSYIYLFVSGQKSHKRWFSQNDVMSCLHLGSHHSDKNKEIALKVCLGISHYQSFHKYFVLLTFFGNFDFVVIFPKNIILFYFEGQKNKIMKIREKQLKENVFLYLVSFSVCNLLQNYIFNYFPTFIVFPPIWRH